jgi:NTP pyrophosphatase (non-canonical NTP hydrolase)
MAVQPDSATLSEVFAAACEPLGCLQQLSRDVYGAYDQNKALLWLCEEVGELLQAIRQNKTAEEVGGEYADVLAWVICLSNILGLSLRTTMEGALTKESQRQLRLYGKLKYWKPE